MGKLHEILAVEGDLAGTAKKIMDEARATFDKKPDHFQSATSRTTYFDESQQNLNTVESKAMVTTVDEKLDYIAPVISRYYDAYVAKESTNQVATADIIVGGSVFFTSVPATVLLGMETKLKELRSVYEAIPTLAPGIFWEKDPEAGEGVYRSRDAETRFVTKNTLVPVELSPATKEHKAQVQAVSQDIPVAKREVTQQSGMLSPGEKSDLLERVDILIRAVKVARQKANSVDALDRDGFGAAIFKFING